MASQASRFELAAFRGAVLECMLDAEVPLRTAIAVIYDAGNRRGVVAERCRPPWTIAQRRTAEDRPRRAHLLTSCRGNLRGRSSFENG